MTKEQLRLRVLSEDPEEAQFLDAQRRAQYQEDLEHLEREEEERNEQIEILKAFLGDDYDKVKAIDEFVILNICGAMGEYALDKIANYEKI